MSEEDGDAGEPESIDVVEGGKILAVDVKYTSNHSVSILQRHHNLRAGQ